MAVDLDTTILEARSDAVDAAYVELIRRGKIGVYGALALVIPYALVLFVHPFANAVHLQALSQISAAALTLSAMLLMYAILLIPIFSVPRKAWVTLLKGDFSSWYVLIAGGIALGIVGGVVNTFAALALMHFHAHLTNVHSDLAYSSKLVLALFGAPIFEELVFQGWLQTRLNRFGIWRSAFFTTCAFVAFHFPYSLYSLQRTFGLALPAIVRARKRSLLACVIIHASMNAVLSITASLLITPLGDRFTQSDQYVDKMYTQLQGQPCSAALAGRWHGKYSEDKNSYETEPFSVVFNSNGCAGSSTELDSHHLGAPDILHARLNADLDIYAPGHSVKIIKRYERDGHLGSIIEYSGRFSPDMQRVYGTWSTEISDGYFYMKR